MSKKIICIDAGHGGTDPGAVNGKYYESNAALAMALSLGRLLTRAGYSVIYTRDKDEFLTLAERCKISNEAGAAAFISIHLNAATNKNAAGIETWIYKGCSKTAKTLAAEIQNKLILETCAKDRGVKKSASLYVLKKTKAPAVLIETGFISNEDEKKKLFTTAYQARLVKAIYKACRAVIK